MAILGIQEEVERMYTAIGWRPYLAIFRPTFVELISEFYSTLDFELPMSYTVDPQISFISV